MQIQVNLTLSYNIVSVTIMEQHFSLKTMPLEAWIYYLLLVFFIIILLLLAK